MDIRHGSFNFPKIEDEGPQTATTQISFPRNVLNVAVGIVGYSAKFENSEDHHLGRLIVELNATINGDDATKVDVSGVFGLRDWSNEWDDPYSGVIDFAVFAELVAVTPPAPGEARGDLIIVDGEVSQVIQHFRSSEHLDSANVFPDNSIRLVASKPTAVRLYVDYDASSGLSPIGTLSGELRVLSGGVITVLAPLELITPRRDSNIERSRRDHTLNFLLPEALCQGAVDITARVFSASDNTQFSREFLRTLTFEPQPELPILAVGIEYTGPDVSDPAALGAPTMADFLTLFGLTEALYPIPSVTITNFLTMTYDKEIKSDINDGCDKFSELKDAVADMRGDSDDIVYGLYNSGLDTGSVGGCGGGGVAVGRIGAQGTAAHEIGHALGRKHAPCDNVTRCAEPLNTDDSYPNYSGYDSDSIGEFGFDTRNPVGRVKNPATAHDMMGYSGDRWISPYTYKALMSRIPETFDGAGAEFAARANTLRAAQDRGCWVSVKQPKLFLRIDVHRDRTVAFQPAFHFPARPRPSGTEATDFVVELQDEQGHVLRSTCLYAESAGCGCGCIEASWPRKIRQAIAFDLRARKLVLYECEKEIAKWPISSAPKLSAYVSGNEDSERGEIEVSWQATVRKDEDPSKLWYLVQWRDRLGTWRGLAPRTQETQLVVPKRIFKGERLSAIRVLASAGIATGEAIWEGEIRPARSEPPPGVEIGLIGVEATETGAHALPRVVSAAILTATGAAISGAQLRWYDSKGGELGRGRSFDLGRLRIGQHQLTATALDDGFGGGSTSWLIEHTRDGRFLLLVGEQRHRRNEQGSEE